MSKPEILVQEIMYAIKNVPVERLNEVLEFLKVLSRDPVELSTEELEELRRARQEIAEGKYVTLAKGPVPRYVKVLNRSEKKQPHVKEFT